MRIVLNQKIKGVSLSLLLLSSTGQGQVLSQASSPKANPSQSLSQTQTQAPGQRQAQAQAQTPAPAPGSHPDLSTNLIEKYLGGRPFLKVADRLLETSELRAFYKLRNDRLIWFTDAQLSDQSNELKEALLRLEQHGLRPEEYWTPMLTAALEAFRSSPSEVAMMRAELLLTDSLLKAANHLSVGRFDPSSIDNDIRYRRKPFLLPDSLTLMNGLYTSGGGIAAALETLAPQHQAYKDLLGVLAELKQRKQQKASYQRLSYPGQDLKPGDTNPIVGKLRQALIDRGFPLLPPTENKNNIYDSELEKAVRSYQAENSMEVGSALQARSEVWRMLSFSLDQRIRQTEINLEKLRWLPRNLESRYIFVNLAFSEFSLYDNGPLVLAMKTVNGRPLWRSPSMRDLVTNVIFNPTWTATDSIVTEQKLPEILKDPTYLQKLRIHMHERTTGNEIPLESVDWQAEGANIIKRALFVQDPGPENALGVVKFPLTNRDDVYMHDTNEKSLFAKGMRQRSSGCIRLEKPLELAAYLLRGTDYTPEKIQEVIAKGLPEETYQTQLRVSLPKEAWLPVYTLYQTVARGENGRIRFATDYYGQDQRVAQAALQGTSKREGP